MNKTTIQWLSSWVTKILFREARRKICLKKALVIYEIRMRDRKGKLNGDDLRCRSLIKESLKINPDPERLSARASMKRLLTFISEKEIK